MICPSANIRGANEQGADILLDYLGGTLDEAHKAELERHAEQCQGCRDLLAVSDSLEHWPAPQVSPDFDARLYARIAREKASQPWWMRFLWRPIVPIGAAIAVMAMALFIHVPTTQDAPKQVRAENTTDIEQAAQTLEDLELLMPLDASSAGSSAGSSSGKM